MLDRFWECDYRLGLELKIGFNISFFNTTIAGPKGQSPKAEHELEQFLKFCEFQKLLFAVGIVTRIWVHRDTIRFWLVHSYQNLESWMPSPPKKRKAAPEPEPFNPNVPSTSSSGRVTRSSEALKAAASVEIKQICYLPKLWKLPDGRMDLDTLMACFNLLLGHFTFSATILDRDSLIEAFGPVIPPVQMFELLELLIMMDCVR